MARYKQGWYKLKNPEKFVQPLDEFMGSYKDGSINYKSSLEYKAFKYADLSKDIKSWSVEPFPIWYIKPTTNKAHRYFVDMLFITNQGRYLIEIKPKSQTLPPKKPRVINEKSLRRYAKDLETFHINQAKWKSADLFAKDHNFEFLIFTEDLLG